jgi:hypothetical protein
MNKTTAAMALSAALLASMTIPVSAAKKYEAVGTLGCAFQSGGSPSAVLCEFQSNAGGKVELYFAQVDKTAIAKTSTVQWSVLRPASSASYQAGGLSGEYISGAQTGGTLVGTGKGGILLQAAQGPALESGISFFKLRTIEK